SSLRRSFSLRNAFHPAQEARTFIPRGILIFCPSNIAVFQPMLIPSRRNLMQPLNRARRHDDRPLAKNDWRASTYARLQDDALRLPRPPPDHHLVLFQRQRVIRQMVRLREAPHMRHKMLPLLLRARPPLQLAERDAPLLLRPAMFTTDLVDATIKRA